MALAIELAAGYQLAQTTRASLVDYRDGRFVVPTSRSNFDLKELLKLANFRPPLGIDSGGMWGSSGNRPTVINERCLRDFLRVPSVPDAICGQTDRS